jgi:hypothetical protein
MQTWGIAATANSESLRRFAATEGAIRAFSYAKSA